MVATWKAVYWSTFILAWLVLPVLYEAWYAGDFTWRERMTSAYLLTAVLGAAFSAYVMLSAEMSFGALAEFLMVFSNTYGLLLVIALLGNGLVEVRGPSGGIGTRRGVCSGSSCVRSWLTRRSMTASASSTTPTRR
jgi:hypothetical protein